MLVSVNNVWIVRVSVRDGLVMVLVNMAINTAHARRMLVPMVFIVFVLMRMIRRGVEMFVAVALRGVKIQSDPRRSRSEPCDRRWSLVQ